MLRISRHIPVLETPRSRMIGDERVLLLAGGGRRDARPVNRSRSYRGKERRRRGMAVGAAEAVVCLPCSSRRKKGMHHDSRSARQEECGDQTCGGHWTACRDVYRCFFNIDSVDGGEGVARQIARHESVGRRRHRHCLPEAEAQAPLDRGGRHTSPNF